MDLPSLGQVLLWDEEELAGFLGESWPKQKDKLTKIVMENEIDGRAFVGIKADFWEQRGIKSGPAIGIQQIVSMILEEQQRTLAKAPAALDAPDRIVSFWRSLKSVKVRKVSHKLHGEIVTSALSLSEPTPTLSTLASAVSRTVDGGPSSSSSGKWKRRRISSPIVSVDCPVLELSGALFPDTYDSVMFVRKVYERFADTATEILRQKVHNKGADGSAQMVRHMIVTGSPGMGKSMWGFYLLHTLANSPEFSDRAFIWEDCPKQATGLSYYFQNDQVLGGKPGDFDRLVDAQTIFLVNGPVLRKIQLQASFFMFCSSKDSAGATRQMLKEAPNTRTVYMPPWELCELIAAAKVTDEARQEWSVRAEFKKFGGSARSVLRQFRNADWNKKFADALQGAMAKYEVGSMLQVKDSSSFVFHLHVLDVDEDCSQTVVKFASDFVEQQLEVLAESDGLRAMLEYVNKHMDNTFEAPVVGKRFELLVHKLFRSKSLSDMDLPARRMGCEQESVFRFDLNGKAGGKFSKLQDIQDGSEGYFTPNSDPHPCYDSIIILGREATAMQITKNRGDSAALMHHVEDLLERFEQVRFIYAVPEVLFKTFPSVRIKDSGVPCEWPEEVEVWFVAIPSNFEV